MVRYELNDSFNGIEIYFDRIPSVAVRDKIKAAGFKWHRAKKCWYAKQTEDRLKLVKKMVEGASESQQEPNDVAPLESIACEVEAPMTRKYCYADSIENFLETEKTTWEKEMRSAFKEESDLPLEQSQIDAWADCYDVLQERLIGDLRGFSIVFEYVLPYENGRRPDVLLVSNEAVIILEFKRKQVVYVADLDQVADYGRDIREYHFESRDKTVIPMLVLTRAENVSYIDKDVRICSSDRLMDNLNAAIKSIGSITSCDIGRWIDSKYEPLPTIVEAARRFWNGEELPNIKHVHAGTNLDEAIACLKSVAEDAESNKKNVLALVTGVPGSGKTFLGLQFVYDVCKANDNQNSVFLSGNGPLVEVLQDALQNRNFVMDVNKVVHQFIDYKATEFNKNIMVFDEGQRAWDEPRMTKSYGAKSSGRSEPDALIQLCDEKLEWCVFLVLVGEGQEINTGENGGIVQWYNAISRSKKSWSVVCPDKLAETFEGADVKTFDDLDLKVSIRSHTAGEVSNFVNKFIAGKLDEAKALIDKIPQQDFHMYYTRDLARAISYCRGKYDHQPEKRYGMIVSSKAKDLARLGMPQPVWENRGKRYPDGSGRRWKVSPWFNQNSNHPDSCCALSVAVTEFDCQGLEIDMPIVGWGDDAKWVNDHWAFSGTDDEKITYRNNSYRVLLTRGREGVIVYIPEGRDDIDDIAAVFERLGISELKE